MEGKLSPPKFTLHMIQKNPDFHPKNGKYKDIEGGARAA